jgi:dTDP-4-dehydrorhamnose 3,5-epimerase
MWWRRIGPGWVNKMQFTPLEIPEVILIEPEVIEDDRGFFMESYQKKEFAAAGIPAEFVQDNCSSSRQGVLRGLHYQIHQTQGKLVRVVAGEIFDVAVDLRRHSASFGRSVTCTLSAENKKQLWVPPGFAHGFFVTSPRAELLYKTTDYYAPEWERTLLWNDPALAIQWPLDEGQSPILSQKDAAGKPLVQAEAFE